MSEKLTPFEKALFQFASFYGVPEDYLIFIDSTNKINYSVQYKQKDNGTEVILTRDSKIIRDEVF